MPRTTILSVTATTSSEPTGKDLWPPASGLPPARQAVSPQAAFIMQDILASNTDPKHNPFWGESGDLQRQVRRPAALKTGTSTDEIDLAAMGFLAPPKDPKAEALAVGAWMGNCDNSVPPNGIVRPRDGGRLWQAFLEDATKGTPVADLRQAAGGHRPGHGRRLQRAAARAVHDQDDQGVLHRRDRPDPGRRHQGRRLRSTRRPACCGRTAASARGHQGLPRLLQRRAGPSDLGEVHRRAGSPGPGAASGVRGGPSNTATAYFHFGSICPFGATWGAPFAPTKTCPIGGPPPEPARRAAHRHLRTDPPARRRGAGAGRADRSETDQGRPVAAFAALAGPDGHDQGCAAGGLPDGIAQGAGPHAVDDRDPSRPASEASSR